MSTDDQGKISEIREQMEEASSPVGYYPDLNEAMDWISTLLARVDALTAERDDAIALRNADSQWAIKARRTVLAERDALRQRVAALEGALRVTDDALVAIINHRVSSGAHPSGSVNPIDGPLIVNADRAVSIARAALAAAPDDRGEG